MLNKKRFLSMILAGCMVCSLGSFASAVDVSEDAEALDLTALSEYAGQSIRVNVVNVDADGTQTQNIIEVAIPEGATVQEQYDVSQAAVQAVTGGAAVTRGMPSGSFMYAVGPFTLTTTASRITSDRFSQDYSTLYFWFYNITSSNGASTINVRLEGDNMTNVYTSGAVSLNDAECTVVMFNNRKYGSGTTDFSKGNSYVVYSSTNTGSVSGNLQVYGL